MSKKIVFLFICSLLYHVVVPAQLVDLNYQSTNEIYSISSSRDTARFTSMKPLLYQNQQRFVSNSKTWLLQRYQFNQQKRSIKQLLFNSHLLQVNEGDVHLSFDPILSVYAGKSSEKQTTLFTSTRGFNVQGVIGQQLSFGTSFTENQSRFPVWVDSIIQRSGAFIPGEGRARIFKKGGFDYSNSSAYVAYSPVERFNVILGYGKNFIGDGYRSLLLSDNAFNYPYLRVQAKFWKIEYTALYSQYMNPYKIIGGSFQRKFSTIHYLNAAITKRFHVAFFESIVWQAKDSTSLRGFDLQYLNPIIFLRPVEFSVGSSDNALMGLNLKYQLKTHSFLYGQFILDDLNLQLTRQAGQQHLNNKYGFQLGIWNKELFAIKRLQHRLEINTVRPFTYGHRVIDQNYTHYNQALAHPIGANFYEIINQFSFRTGRWYAELHSVGALAGEDNNSTLNGGNLWAGESGVRSFGSKTLDGLKTKVSYQQLKLAFTINPTWNTDLVFTIANRFRKNEVRTNSETCFFFGIITNRGNPYVDY